MSVKDLTDEQILEHLKNNTILRNNQLTVLIKLLNSLDDGTTLAIDGAWGSGKTVFVKQLLVLADDSVEDYGNNTLDKAAIETLRENQKTFYFNEWENDYIDDALGAVLLKLIAENDPSLQLESIKSGLAMINVSAGIKELTKGWIDPTKKPKKSEIVKHVKPLVDRRDTANDFIDQIKKHKQRLIFIIDELDRCKPSFAVDLLEVIKHYFVREDVTFIVTANLKELTHTIKKYYGEGFDGAGYLNKFFDFNYGLAKVDVDRYAREVINWQFDGGMVSGTARDAIKYFDFQMREINAYISALRLVEGFINSSRSIVFNPREDAFVKCLLVPFALALKVRNDSNFSEFANGTSKGADALRIFAESSEEMKSFAQGIELSNVSTELEKSDLEKLQMEELVELYRKMFQREDRDNRIAMSLQSFQEAISLLGSYTTIPEAGEKE